MNPDFLDILRALSEAQADFLIVGAFAVGQHAEPRATGDLDILVRPTPENAKKVYQALVNFGAPLGELTESDLAVTGQVFQMGLPPFRIDILTEISGVPFPEAWESRVATTIEDIPVQFIGRAALIKNKRATNRPKDRFDLELLEEHK